MEFAKLLSVILASALISSCASLGMHSRTDRISKDQAQLVSRDFVTAISRLRGFSPRETTVQFHNPTTTFSLKLHDAMRGAGYGIQIVPKEERGGNHVSYVSDQYETSDGTTVAYEVTVGRVKLGREYEIRFGRVFPIAALSVNGGTSDGDTSVDNSIFRQTDNDEWNEVPTNKSVVTTHQSNTPEIPYNQLGSLKSRLHLPTAAKKNVADIGQSNYSSLFKLYEPARSATLIFPNDSFYLGSNNKSTIFSFAKQFDPEKDVISVMGCSRGRTNIKNGNALLANGRASRVKEELIMADVMPDNILDEGCWAATKIKDLPSRGVIITLLTKSKRG